MLQGKIAVVTGASRGIGHAVARALAERGADLLVHATATDRLDGICRDIRALGRRAVPFAGDVAAETCAQEAIAKAEAALGPVDILVNNAGINLRGASLEMDLAAWQRVLDVNLNGTLHFCRAVLPGMIARRGGVIVNVSSSASKAPHKNAAPAYGASKAAVNYLTMHLAQEMAPHNIRVNAVCPGPVETDMSNQWSPEYRGQVTSRVPLGRLGAAPEIAETVVFLASDMSGFVTGATLNANGGTLMG